MLRFSVSTALLLAAVPALAQQPPAPPAAGPHAAIQTAATAFAQCVTTGVQGLDASVTPEAGAASVLGGCTTQRDGLVQAVEALIATMPADQQAAAHEQARIQLGQVETHIAEAIRQQRAAPMPAPAE